MALKQRLDAEEQALLEIIEDPVWLGEFLRSTADGESDTNVWPPVPWNYRDYQRQFLTDQSEFILYTGGRAIGKCSPSGSKVYTTDGYCTVGQLAKRDYFIAYALDKDTQQLVQRRAVAVRDKLSSAYTIRTASGHTFMGTLNHPILTPTGYKLMADIQIGDYAAVVTRLPFESTRRALQWHELRLLGYIYLTPKWRTNHKISPRFKKIGAEIEEIASRFYLNWHKDFDGNYTLIGKVGPFPHPVRSLFNQLSIRYSFEANGMKRISDVIKQECLENIQVFLEALFAQFANLTMKEISIKVPKGRIAEDLQELLLRFGIETRIENAGDDWIVSLLDYRAVYRFWNTFNLPGVNVTNLPLPPATHDAAEFMRFEPIVDKYQSHKVTDTYAVYVYEDNNYIGDNLLVHNSVVLEDKIVYDVVNSEKEFPITPEMVFVTANQAQMTMPQNRLILRFTSSTFLKDFLQGRINKSTGIMEFPRKKRKPFTFWMRIAGSHGEQNMVGLHIPKIIGDEMQLFPLSAWTQLQPAYNQWEQKRQQIHAGVPNGLRNSVLYILDMQTPKYKKYRIPAPNNVMGYSYENYLDDLRRYGGEQDDRFQQLVLGRHGAAAFQVIPRESITIETYAFHNMRYNSGHVLKGIHYRDVLQRPRIPENITRLIFAIDPGFADPTLIQILGRDNHGIWRTYVRYRLTRIDFNEQQNIIHWLDDFYHPQQIAIDIGAGGNGAAIMHNMMHGDSYKGRAYDKKFVGLQFKEAVVAGYDEDGEELVQDAKGFAATELAQIIQDGKLVFSEIDNEGLSQIERIAKKKTFAGRDQYFVLSERGNSGKGGVGPDEDDHIFSSYICFVLAIREEPLNPTIKKLGRAKGALT